MSVITTTIKRSYVMGIKTVLCLVMAVCMMPAVSAQNNNLLVNGDFEGQWEGSGTDAKPEGWRITGASGTKCVTDQTREGGSGSKVFMAWLSNGGSISPKKESEPWRFGPLDVGKGETYKLTIWHKVKDARKDLTFRITFNFYNCDKAEQNETWISTDEVGGSFVVKKSENDVWAMYEQEFVFPADDQINAAGMSIRFPYDNDGEVYLDDISLVKTEGSTPPDEPKLDEPQGLAATGYQREVELRWQKSSVEGIAYQVRAMLAEGGEESVIQNITENSVTLEKLMPGRSYNVELYAVNDKGEKSNPAKITVKTDNLERAANSEDRIPYLRTIEPGGTCKGRFLKLYYNDLGNPDAKISYKLNGQPIQPQNNTLEFPAFEGYYKRFQLEIYIDEGEGREWEILYNELNVQNF